MRAKVIFGIVLIVLGILAMIYQGIPYSSQRDTIRLGPVQTSVETRKVIAMPRAVGGLIVAGGVALVVTALKKKG